MVYNFFFLISSIIMLPYTLKKTTYKLFIPRKSHENTIWLWTVWRKLLFSLTYGIIISIYNAVLCMIVYIIGYCIRKTIFIFLCSYSNFLFWCLWEVIKLSILFHAKFSSGWEKKRIGVAIIFLWNSFCKIAECSCYTFCWCRN